MDTEQLNDKLRELVWILAVADNIADDDYRRRLKDDSLDVFWQGFASGASSAFAVATQRLLRILNEVGTIEKGKGND